MKLIRFVLTFGLFAFFGMANSRADQLNGDTVESIKLLIAPTEGEQEWLSIPWETDLAAAREKAAREGKPVFLWEMDGHPLGCT